MTSKATSPVPVQNQNGTKYWAWTIATFFGAGFGKPGPGTWGSVATVLLWALFAWAAHPTPQILLYGLFLLIAFRLFDITKPFPIRRLENLPEGWGIVLDDVAAGLYALGVASVLRIWIH